MFRIRRAGFQTKHWISIPTFKSNYQDKSWLFWIVNKTINPNNLITYTDRTFLRDRLQPCLSLQIIKQRMTTPPQLVDQFILWIFSFKINVKNPRCWRVQLFKLRQTERDFNYCLGLVWIRKSQDKWLWNWQIHLSWQTEIQQKPASSSLCPDWSQAALQVNPGTQPNPVLWLLINLSFIRRSKMNKGADTGQEVPVGSRRWYYVRMVGHTTSLTSSV